MTQIIFQFAAIACSIYTLYRFGLFICKKVCKNKRNRVTARVTSVEAVDEVKPVNGQESVSPIVIEKLANSPITKHLGIAAYRATYLDNYPIASRIQVYIDRDSHTHIKRFLAVVAPDASMSGYISKIIDEHLKRYENEMSELYTKCITQPL